MSKLLIFPTIMPLGHGSQGLDLALEPLDPTCKCNENSRALNFRVVTKAGKDLTLEELATTETRPADILNWVADNLAVMAASQDPNIEGAPRKNLVIVTTAVVEADGEKSQLSLYVGIAEEDLEDQLNLY